MHSNVKDNKNPSLPFPKMPSHLWFDMVYKDPFGLRDYLQKSGTKTSILIKREQGYVDFLFLYNIARVHVYCANMPLCEAIVGYLHVSKSSSGISLH